MLDMKFVRDHLDEVQAMLERRHNPMKLDDFSDLEKRRREILGEVEALKGKRNAASKEISVMKKNGENADALVKEMREVGDKIAALDGELKETEEKLREILLRIPNMPKEDVPLGVDDNDNPELRKWGEPQAVLSYDRGWDRGLSPRGKGAEIGAIYKALLAKFN